MRRKSIVSPSVMMTEFRNRLNKEVRPVEPVQINIYQIPTAKGSREAVSQGTIFPETFSLVFPIIPGSS